MSEQNSTADTEADISSALRERAEQLEREITKIREEGRLRLIKAELKAEAAKAGMIDIDGLKLLDASELTVADDGTIVGATRLMDIFKKAKPWLFPGGSSSISVQPPAPQPARAKLATEMSDTEYKAARAAILRQRD
jgi:hypothetical protein